LTLSATFGKNGPIFILPQMMGLPRERRREKEEEIMKARMVLCLVVVWMVLYGGSVWGYTESDSNNFFGTGAGNNTIGNDNTFIGAYAGWSNTTGSGNVFLGYQAGYNETGSNRLYIANSSTTTPLIYGEFDNSIALINGNFRVFSPDVATYADILGRSQPAGTGIDIETPAGAPPAGPVQAINGAFLVKYTPGSPIPNNFNALRMTARTDATMTDQLNGRVAAGNFQAQHNGGGTASAVVGVIANAYLLGSGNVTNAIAVTAGNPVRSGTGVITNAYGVDIQAQKITGVTNAYGVYQSGASDVNYFAGNIGVGKTNPTNPIEAASGAHLSAGGRWISASSREQKENIKDLGAEEADAALSELKPVRYRYKNAVEENHVGFIAEDVPELVATRDRKGLSPMDIVAVLTKVVQGLKAENEGLKAKNESLENRLLVIEAAIKASK
jgi:hypothetical protein